MPALVETHLRPDQNFFQQPPYDYLELVADARGLELVRLRTLTTYVYDYQSRNHLEGLPDAEVKATIARTKDDIEKVISRASSRGVTGRLKRGSGILYQNVLHG